MLNKLVKGFVIGTALIGSLTMVGCESTESVLAEETEVITDENEGNKDYDPYTKTLVEEELNEFHMDCRDCGRPEVVYEKANGNLLYDVCVYCYAVYKNQLFTGKYECNECEEIVENFLKPVAGKGSSLVCEDCYEYYHNPKTNENLDSEGNFINNLE